LPLASQCGGAQVVRSSCRVKSGVPGLISSSKAPLDRYIIGHRIEEEMHKDQRALTVLCIV
jgi:hypothetical protein